MFFMHVNYYLSISIFPFQNTRLGSRLENQRLENQSIHIYMMYKNMAANSGPAPLL